MICPKLRYLVASSCSTHGARQPAQLGASPRGRRPQRRPPCFWVSGLDDVELAAIALTSSSAARSTRKFPQLQSLLGKPLPESQGELLEFDWSDSSRRARMLIGLVWT